MKNESLLIFLIISLNLIAIVATGFLTFLLKNLEIGSFFKGAIGAIIGLGIELIRIFAARGIVGDTFEPSGNFLPWIVNFRIFGIPILIGIGFMIASSLKPEQSQICPKCKKEFTYDPDQMKGLTAVKSGESGAANAEEYKNPLPLLQNNLSY